MRSFFFESLFLTQFLMLNPKKDLFSAVGISIKISNEIKIIVCKKVTLIILISHLTI